jgi:ribosomal-protein-alanine N-acetyltransferase
LAVWLFTTLKAEQISDVLEIEQASFQHPWNRRSFEDEFASRDAAHYAVLDSERRCMIGYLFVRIVSREMHLMKIAVAPRWRRNGVAAWTLEQCFAKARRRGIEKVILEVRASNRAAISLYAKLGFSGIGIRQRYYSDTGENALVMAKNLDP